MIEKTLERIADALEEGNKLLREGLDFRKSLAGPSGTPAAPAPAKEAKAPKAPKPEVLPDPEPESDGLDEPAVVVTKADIRDFHKATTAKGPEAAAKVKAFFLPALTSRGAILDGKPNLNALADDALPEFLEAFKAAVA